MFVHTAAHNHPRARSPSKPRRETPSPNLVVSSSPSAITLAAPFVPRGPSSLSSSVAAAKDSDPHGQGAVLPPVPLKFEYNKSSQLSLRRRSSSTANADRAPSSDSKPHPEKKGHARRSSWQRRLSIGGSAALSATSLDRLDGLHRRPSVSSPKSPQTLDPPTPDPKKSVTVDTVPVLPRTVYNVASTSTTAAPAIVAPWTQPPPTEHFAPRTTSLRGTQGQERPRQASASRSPLKEEPAEARDRPRKLQKRNASLDNTSKRRNPSQDTTASKASQDTLREGERNQVDRHRQKERREKDKKSMLSRALQKAQTAVLLDNVQNFEGAIHAYADACELLQQVLIRSPGEDEKRKLEAIVRS